MGKKYCQTYQLKIYFFSIFILVTLFDNHHLQSGETFFFFILSFSSLRFIQIDEGFVVYTVNVFSMKTKNFPCVPFQLSVNISSVLHVFVWMVRRENQMRRDIPARVPDWCHLEERGWRVDTMSVLIRDRKECNYELI